MCSDVIYEITCLAAFFVPRPKCLPARPMCFPKCLPPRTKRPCLTFRPMLRPARPTSLPLFFICPEGLSLFCCAITHSGERAKESAIATTIETMINFCLIFILSLCTTEFAGLCATTLSLGQQKFQIAISSGADFQILSITRQSGIGVVVMSSKPRQLAETLRDQVVQLETHSFAFGLYEMGLKFQCR